MIDIMVQENKDQYSISLKDPYGTYTVSMESESDLSAFDLVDKLFKPCLIAAGYHPSTVERIFKERPDAESNYT